MGVLAAFYFTGCTIIAALIVSGLPEPAYAYVDPSVMTYTIQAVAGAAVALSAVVGVAFRRTRKWLFNLLGIDPEAKREADPAWAELERASDQAVFMSMDALGNVEHAAGGRDRLGGRDSGEGDDAPAFSWPKRFALSFLVSFMTVGTLLFMAPIEIVAGGGSDFYFTPQAVAPLAIAETLAISLAVALLLSVFRGRSFLYALAGVFAIGLGFFAQAMFLNYKLPIADGSTVDWAKFDRIALVSAAAWLAIGVVSMLLVRLMRNRCATAIAALACVLVIVQGVGAAAILLDDSGGTLVDGSPAARKAIVTEQGLFDVGDKNNIIVFVLDTYDTADFEAALKQDPSIADALTGFTWYDNVCGAVIPTRYGVPFLLTNERPHDDETWNEYLKQRYDRSSFLSDLVDAGYSTGVYTTNLMTKKTTPEIAQEKVVDLIFNASDVAVAELDYRGAVGSMATMALYRDLPWVLKPRFWFDTDDVVADMMNDDDESDPRNVEYKRDDAQYYKRLQAKGLTVEDRGASGTFRFIHLTGDHAPYIVNAQGEAVSKNSVSRTDQAVGTMRIAEYYLEELKRLGLYDDATIIFTADHGRWKQSNEKLKAPSSPYILLKPSQTHEEAQSPMAISHAPVMHDDVVPTIVDVIGGDTTKYSGTSLFRYTGDEDQNATRLYLSTQGQGMTDYTIVEYAIRGDVLDFDNWSLTGRTWNALE